MKQSIFWVCASLLLSCETTPSATEKFVGEIDSLITHSDFNGVVLIQQNGQPVYSIAQGVSDISNQTPLDLEDQFVIGSISKQITAVMVLKAMEQQKLRLEDPIELFLPDLPQPWKAEISIHQLLTHTHGITATDQPLAFEPGSQFQYSQLGYGLLAEVLEKVYSESFESLTMEFFKEQGLLHSFHPANSGYNRLVKGYEEDESGELIFSENSLANYVAAGSFISTASDLATWNEALHSGKLVTQASLDLMQTRYATRIHPIFDTVEYGYGLLFKEGEEHLQIGALGYAPGFVSASYYYPQSGLNVIVLENVATSLDNFTETFRIHTLIMERAKRLPSSQHP